jgi:Na+/melibiose symporter-like transporter
VRAFVGKVISASAVLITGLLLDLVHFPAGAQPGSVSQDVLTNLGFYFTPLYLAIGLVAAASLWGYRISRAVHSDNLAAVARDA